MLFFRPMYLQGLIFAVADAIFETEVSETCFSLNLQMLFSLPVMYNCIYILSFLGFKDTSFANLASTSHVFDNVRMLPSKIPHPQPVLSIPCRYSPVKLCILNLLFQCFAGCSPSKFCIFNPLESTIADIVARYPLSSIYCSIRSAIQTASGAHLLLRLLILSNQYQFLRNS